MPGDQPGELRAEGPEDGGPFLAGEVEVDPYVQAAFAEVPVEGAREAVALHQGPELPQIGAEPLGRDRRVLPSGPGLRPVGPAGGQPGAVLPDAPQPAGVGRIGDDPAAGETGRLPRGRQEILGAFGQLGWFCAQFREEPGVPGRQGIDGGAGLGPGHHVGQGLVEALQGEEFVPEQRDHGLRRRVRVLEAEDHQGPRGRRLDQPDGGGQHQRQGALAAHERPGEVEPALGQQVFQRVPGHLAGEPAELGAQRGEVVPGEGGQGSDEAGPVVADRYGPVDLLAAHLTQPDDGPAVGDDLQLDHVVRGAAPREGVSAAGVVPDHAAEGAAAVGGGIGAEEQAVSGRRVLEVVQHDAGLDGGGTGPGVQAEEPVEGAGEVQHDARADRLAGGAGPRAPRGDGHPQLPAHRQRVEDVRPLPGKTTASGICR